MYAEQSPSCQWAQHSLIFEANVPCYFWQCLKRRRKDFKHCVLRALPCTKSVTNTFLFITVAVPTSGEWSMFTCFLHFLTSFFLCSSCSKIVCIRSELLPWLFLVWVCLKMEYTTTPKWPRSGSDHQPVDSLMNRTTAKNSCRWRVEASGRDASSMSSVHKLRAAHRLASQQSSAGTSGPTLIPSPMQVEFAYFAYCCWFNPFNQFNHGRQV